VTAAPLMIGGFCLLLLALYFSIDASLGAPAAAAITGFVTLAVSGGLLWMFKKTTD